MWDNNPQPSSLAQSSVHHSTDAAGVFVLEQVNLSEVAEDFSHSRLGEVPLKAVCKDSVVGIRYATGHQVGSLIFNRFQVRFQRPDDCLKFLASIEAICPCRMSGVSQDTQDLSSSSQLQMENTYSGVCRSSALGTIGSAVTPRAAARTGPPLQAAMVTSATPARDLNEHIQRNTIAPSTPEELSIQPVKSVTQTADEFIPPWPQECQSRTRDGTQSHGNNQFDSRKQLQPITPPITPNFDQARLSHLDGVSDEILEGYIRDIALEPGFGDFVKRVKRLLPHP